LRESAARGRCVHTRLRFLSRLTRTKVIRRNRREERPKSRGFRAAFAASSHLIRLFKWHPAPGAGSCFVPFCPSTQHNEACAFCTKNFAFECDTKVTDDRENSFNIDFLEDLLPRCISRPFFFARSLVRWHIRKHATSNISFVNQARSGLA